MNPKNSKKITLKKNHAYYACHDISCASPAGRCSQALPLVGGHHNNVGVSLWERRATTQVMLGVSLRVRWDATLVIIIRQKQMFQLKDLSDFYKYNFD